MKHLFLALAVASLAAVAFADPAASVVKTPPDRTNSFYLGNRAPLAPAFFLSLPAGAVQPRGWLAESLRRQRDGLCGNLGEISVWLQKEGNAWLSKDGKGKYGWEEVPYWLRGYIALAYILNDPKMINESKVWINGALNSQRPDGDFGPDQRFDDDGSRDFWANMLMLYCLETYYDQTADPRVLELMTRYFHFQLTVPDEKFLTHYWQKMRGGDNLFSVYWLYNRTGDAQLLQLADKIHRCTANWEMPNTLPNWHNVNIAESFREPATHFLQTHDDAELHASYADFAEVRERFGQVPGGMFGGDENCRAGYSDPHQAVETCGMVEQMFSDELLLPITGDASWADNCEDVAFNSYPAATMPDLRSLRYLTAPNMVVSDSKNHAPGLQNNGPFLMMNPFSSRCCQHNHSMGWPFFAQHLWYATPDNGLCAAIYSASEVTAQAGTGEKVRIEEVSNYPFEEEITFKLHVAQPVSFPFYLRIPGWCSSAEIAVNGKRVFKHPSAGQFSRLSQTWKEGDQVTLKLPMSISVRRWPANQNSASIYRGPLAFSLKIGERYERKDSSKTAISDSGWQKSADASRWPSFEIYPTTAWNYGLVLDENWPLAAFSINRHSWPRNNYPFTVEDAPIELQVAARKIPDWTLDKHELAGALHKSPIKSDAPIEKVTLIPMGAARLRISSFPVIGSGTAAHEWTSAK